MKKTPFVSIIIPCYQEEAFIGGCLDSLVENGYPLDRMEILVMDGGSTDGTRKIVEDYSRKFPFIFLKDNPEKFAPFAMNRGIKESRGVVIIRCDAHACYKKGYIAKLADWLEKDPSIGNAGGIWVNKAASGGLKAKAIAGSLGSPFCVGPNRYRTGISKQPSYVDTVPFGAWRRGIFEEVGLFDEDFLRTQDLEFNMRLKKAGYRILLDPGIKSHYFTRSSFRNLFKMMYQYGYWKNLVNKKLKILSSARQFFPPVFVLYLVSAPFLILISGWFLAPLLLYSVFASGAALYVSIQAKETRMFPHCAAAFFVSHFGYGTGYLAGFFDFFIRGKKRPGRVFTDVTR